MPIKVKDHDKCKEWERRRRDRLNDAFKNLAQLLPHYDPALIPAKIDILEKSTEFVKELRLSNSRLLSHQAEADEKCKLIKELQDEVNKLILRVKQLTILLKKANITIPTGPEIKTIGVRRFKWSGRVTPEVVKNRIMIKNKDSPGPGVGVGLLLVSQKQGEPKGADTSSSTNEVTLCVSSSSLKEPEQCLAKGVTTNTTSVNTSVASIIVPLKEINNTNSVTEEINSTAITTTGSASITCSKTIAKSQTTRQTLSNSTPILSPTTPTACIQKSTTSLVDLGEQILVPVNPMNFQTFVITSSGTRTPNNSKTAARPLTVQSQQNPQLLTSGANILPVSILPRTQNNPLFKKVPIKPLLKPIPKVIKRRRRRKKNEQVPESTNVATVNKMKSKVTKQDKGFDQIIPIIPDNSSVSSETTPQRETTEIPKKQPYNGEAFSHSRCEGNVQRNDKIIGQPERKQSEEAVESKNTCIAVKVPQSDSVSVAEKTTAQKNVEDDKELPLNTVPVLRIIEACSLDKISMKMLSTNDVRSGAEEAVTSNSTSLVNFATLTTKIANIEQIVNVEGERTLEEQRLGGQEHVVIDNAITDKVILSSSSDLCPEDNVLQRVLNACVDKAEPDKIDTIKELGDIKDKGMDTNTCLSIHMCSQAIGTTKMVPTASTEDAIAIESCQIKLTVEAEKEKNSDAHISTNDVVAATDKAIATSLLNQTLHHNNQPRVVEKATHPLDEDESDMHPLILLQHLPVETTNLGMTPTEPTPDLTSLDDERDAVDNDKNSKNVTETGGLLAIESSSKENEATVVSTTTEKISECIARSIDIIDANDSELMELGEHWEDAGASPKSISPTQIFLNMFPLLPRESSAAEPLPHLQQQNSSSNLTAVTSLASKGALSVLPTGTTNISRSSFFIDAMLPDEHAVGGDPSNGNENADVSGTTSNSPYLPLTPPQSSSNTINQQMSSSLSLPSNYYWTPSVTSSVVPSSNILEYASLEYRPGSHSTALFQQLESQQQRVCNIVVGVGLNSATTTTTTPTTKSLTTHTTSGATSIATASNKSCCLTETVRGTKRPKSITKSSAPHDNTERLPFTFDTSVSAFSSNKAIPASTGTKTASSTAVAVTWALTVPSTSQTSTCHQHSQQLQPIGMVTTTKQNCLESKTVFSSSVNPPSASHPHSCSILDSLNTMDAAFFRPLMNVLEAHDFRGMDYSGGNTLPPPPPLPPLIPAPSTKTVYPSHFKNTKSSQLGTSSTNSLYSDHNSTTKFQGTYMHSSGNIFTGTHVQPLLTTENIFHSSTSVASIKHHHDIQSQQQHHMATTPVNRHLSAVPAVQALKPGKKNIAESCDATNEKTIRAVASHKKNRSGKNSRIQSCAIPSCHPYGENRYANGKIDSKHEQHAAVSSQQKKASTIYSSYTIQSHLTDTTKSNNGTNFTRSLDFHPSSSVQLESSIMPPQKYDAIGNSGIYHAETRASKNSESKPCKKPKHDKDKMQSYNHHESTAAATQTAAKLSKTSRNEHTLAIAALASTNHPHNRGDTIDANNITFHGAENKTNGSSGSIGQAAANVGTTEGASAKLPLLHQPLAQSSNSSSSDFNFSQVFQMHHHHSTSESFQLFPECNTGTINCRTSNAVSNSNHHSHSHNCNHQHDNHNSYASLPHQTQVPQSASSSSNFHIQRSHPYYFSDIASSFENISVIPVHHTQPSSNENSSKILDNNHSHTQLRDSSDTNKFEFGTNVSAHCHIPQMLATPQSTSQVAEKPDFVNVLEQQQKGSGQQQIQQLHQRSFAQRNPTAILGSSNIQTVMAPTPQTAATTVLVPRQQSVGGAPRPRTHHSTPCHQTSPQQRHQNRCYQSHVSTATTTSAPSSSSAVSSGKVKQPGHSISSYGSSSQQQQAHPPQIVPGNKVQQQHLQLHIPQHQRSQQTVRQQPQPLQNLNRSSFAKTAKTVNWMTDTGYRSTSATAESSKQQHRQGSSTASTSNNPFSVSKLVGPSSSSVPTKIQQTSNNVVVDVTGNIRVQQPQSSSQATSHSATPIKNKISRSGCVTTSNGSLAVSAPLPTRNHSQNQSNYCAEALIRKNPQSSAAEWTPHNFNHIQSTTALGLTGTSYPFAHVHNHGSPPVQPHHQHNTVNANFLSYSTNTSQSTSSYLNAVTATPGGSHVSSCNSSHLNHFEHSQSHYYTTTNHQHSYQDTSGQTILASNSNYDNASLSSQQQRQHGLQIQHEGQSSSGSDLQAHYDSNHHNHSSHYHQHQHQSSTVTNFNLSTIFPEINDNQNGSSTSLGRGGGTSGTDSKTESIGASSSPGDGGINPIYGYHHQSNFGGESGR